eukprot:s1_g2002.t1
MTPDQLIKELGLQPHPEGGHFCETFRDEAAGEEERAHSTAIYYLLKAGERSHWHRVDATEIWHWYAGDPLRLSVATDSTEDPRHTTLGPNIPAGERPQGIVRKDEWQAAEPLGDWTLASGPSQACIDAGGPSRTVIVPTKPQSYGTMQYARTVDLESKEVVLTFDDGPDPNVTPSILDTLDKYCVKATFFFTGHRAERYPHLVREAARRGHTIASHSYSHPNNLRRLSWNRATRQITRGIAEIQEALDGDPKTAHIDVAPFFRFPGLNHSSALRGWLAARDISTFSCDVGTDDWRRISSRAVVYRAVRNIRSKSGGIVIFHDTKQRTAAALPFVLQRLRSEGYRVAHMVPERDLPEEPLPANEPSADGTLAETPALETPTDLSLSSAL